MSKAASRSRQRGLGSTAMDRLMPRHAPFWAGLVLGLVALVVSILTVPEYAVTLAPIGLFVGILAVSYVKLPWLTADYLREHARDEDTPALGIFFVVLVVVVTSVVSLFMALSEPQGPDPWLVAASVTSVLLGWFTVQALGAFHYAYEYYQAPDPGGEDQDVEGGLEFPGDEDPDGTAFMYFSYTIGTSVATSDTKLTSNAMRRRVTVHLVFSHLFNTIILASAVNVILSLGGGGGG